MAPKLRKAVRSPSEKIGLAVCSKNIWHINNSRITDKMNCALIEIIHNEKPAKFQYNWRNAINQYLKKLTISKEQLLNMLKSGYKSLPSKKRRNSILTQYMMANRDGKLNGTLKDHITRPCDRCAPLIRQPATVHKKSEVMDIDEEAIADDQDIENKNSPLRVSDAEKSSLRKLFDDDSDASVRSHPER